MNVLLFAGAGTSVDIGIPAMRQMLEQFRNHLQDLGLPDQALRAIDDAVRDGDRDMEYIIDLIDRVEAGHSARLELGERPTEESVAPYRTIRGEAEWFVQHCCERIDTAKAVQLWWPLLRTARALPGTNISIATTNYDRAIETAAVRHSVTVGDGFSSFEGREFAEWTGTWNAAAGVALYKLHGSTDWYRGAGDSIIKLRHPMPLFGGLKVVPHAGVDAVGSALVLPSREKVVTNPPFQEISYQFRRSADDADVLIFAGTSLRDPHIRDVCRKHAPSKPTYVVSRAGRFSPDVCPPEARIIRESAARFLISTLPRFLIRGDFAFLDGRAAQTNADESQLLDWLATALDENARVAARCSAVENMAQADVSLLKDELLRMMNAGATDVSTFSLGLVQLSDQRDDLLQAAQENADKDAPLEFREELRMLREFLSPQNATSEP